MITKIKNQWQQYLVANKHDKIFWRACWALPFNGINAVGNLLVAGWQHSPWMLVLSACYLIITFARGWAIQQWWRNHPINTYKGGLFLLTLGAIYSIFAAIMLSHGYTRPFTPIAAYFVAIMAFTKLFTAISGLFRARRLHTLDLTLLKAYALADGTLAIVITHYALLHLYHPQAASIYAGAFGLVLALIYLIGGAIVVLYSRQKQK